MGSDVKVTWKFPNLAKAYRASENDILLFIAAMLQTNRGMMFDTSNAGRTPWPKPLLRRGQPLSQRGPLRQSFGPANDGKQPARNPGGIVRMNSNVVTIGTSLKYAPVLNEGAIIYPRKGKWLWIPLPDGAANSSNAPTPLAKSLRKASGRRKKDNGWKWTKTQGGALVVKAPSGKVFLLAKKANIPRRPMDEWVESDQRELEEALRNKLAQVLKNA